MDVKVEKIKGFANWMDRKPRSWLLFVLSAGLLFVGYDDYKSHKRESDCYTNSSMREEQMRNMLYNLIDRQLDVNTQKMDSAEHVQNVLEKAKQTIQEVKNKI